MDEYTQGIRTILEYIVYTASYDHVGFFFCKVVDYFSLVVKKILIGDEILATWLVQVSLVDAVLAAKKRSLDFISRFYFAASILPTVRPPLPYCLAIVITT